jgi:hypothetical protein
MKIIVAGSRHLDDWESVCNAIDGSPFAITEVVSGTAIGIDQLGEAWAAANGIPVKAFPAPWKEKGKLAGKIRNIEMAVYADGLVAVWDGMSPGTAHMIAYMVLLNKPVHIYTIGA